MFALRKTTDHPRRSKIAVPLCLGPSLGGNRTFGERGTRPCQAATRMSGVVGGGIGETRRDWSVGIPSVAGLGATPCKMPFCKELAYEM